MTDTTETGQQEMGAPPPAREHEWLQQLLGEWSYESEASMGPGEPVHRSSGRHAFEAIGPYWLVGRGTGQSADGDAEDMIVTLGFDPATSRFVGTWIGSMMSNLWVYDGELDATGKTLALYSTGPSMSGEGTADYKDVIEITDGDHHTFAGHFKDENGGWQRMMVSRYTRKG